MLHQEKPCANFASKTLGKKPSKKGCFTGDFPQSFFQFVPAHLVIMAMVYAEDACVDITYKPTPDHGILRFEFDQVVLDDCAHITGRYGDGLYAVQIHSG